MAVSDVLNQLVTAVAGCDLEGAAAQLDALVAALGTNPAAVDAAAQEEAFKQLRRARYFALMKRLGEALRSSGAATCHASRQYGQALIELNELDAALAVFTELVATPTCPEGERVEAEGLIGRVHKQRYVDFATPAGTDPGDSLRSSIKAYDSVYRRDPAQYTWHGINLVALLARARRDQVAVQAPDAPEALAKDILAVTASAGDRWSMATAAEACVALRDWKNALSFAEKYVTHPEIDAFSCASTLRQLKQVWLLSESGEGGELVTLLQCAVLRAASDPHKPLYQRVGAAVSFGAGELDAARAGVRLSASMLEKVFGDKGFRSTEWVRKSLDRARAVARIETAKGKGIGTGFVVRAASLFGALAENADEFVLVTNAHVLGDTCPDALRVPDAVIRFQDIDNESTVRPTEILFESEKEKLDVTIVRLNSAVTGVQPYEVSSEELPVDAQRPRFLYVIGHPSGGMLSLSYEDNLQLDWLSPRVHYRTPTEPGSSGSPVFDESWRLVAVHHAGSEKMPRLHGAGTYSANEGIWIQAIVEAIAADRAAHSRRAAIASPPVRPPFRSGIVVCHARSDQEWLRRLQTHIVASKLDVLSVWDDQRLLTQADARAMIEREMESASVAVLLVSPDFLVSELVRGRVLPLLLRANVNRGLVVAPIAVGRARYQLIPELAGATFLNGTEPPLADVEAQKTDAALDKICGEIGRLLDVGRISNSLRAMDAVSFQASGFGGTAPSAEGVAGMSSRATQVERKIVIEGHSQLVIAWEQLSTLQEGDRQLIYAYDATIRKLLTAYNEEFPNRVSDNPVTRDRAVRVVRDTRTQLCQTFNELLDFFTSIGCSLNDHYGSVRFICTKSMDV